MRAGAGQRGAIGKNRRAIRFTGKIFPVGARRHCAFARIYNEFSRKPGGMAFARG